MQLVFRTNLVYLKTTYVFKIAKLNLFGRRNYIMIME